MAEIWSPYQVLGLTADATPDQVKRKFRRLAKQHHPDVGGDPVLFARIKAAYDILMDPERRAHFDATGEIQERVVDNADANALSLIMQAFDFAMNDVAQAGRRPKDFDCILMIKKKLSQMQQKRHEERGQIKEAIEIWSDMRQRFAVKDGKPNHFQATMDYRVAQCRQRLANADNQDKDHARAMEILADYSFHRDEDKPPAPGNLYRTLAGATGW